MEGWNVEGKGKIQRTLKKGRVNWKTEGENKDRKGQIEKGKEKTKGKHKYG